MACEMTLDYRLRLLDFDRYGRIQPATILDVCQDVATLQATDMGIGRDDMLAQGVFWAVVRTKLEITSTPQEHEVVSVRTWPHSPSSFSFMRDFTICGKDNELVAKATSEWVLVNLKSRRFEKLKDHYNPTIELVKDRAFESKMRKAPNFAKGNRAVHTVVPTYSDIDANGHVNNARYPSFVLDALNPGPDGQLRTMQIDYRHEVMPHSPLQVHTLVEDGRILSKGVREDGNVAFACVIELEQRQA